MKKLLALLLAVLVLVSMPLPSVRADEGNGAAPEKTSRPHDKPKREKSLEYWEQVELPELTLTGNFREDVLTVARSQLGYTADRSCYEETSAGRKRYYTRYGAWDGATFADWCDSFVSFCIYYAGNTSYPGESSCGRHMFFLKAAGYWREWNSYIPKPGDIVFFKLNESTLAPNHVALVEKVIPAEGDQGGKLITIEGNVNDPNGVMTCVRRMTRSLDQVVGYGTYEQGKTYPAEYTVRSDGWEIIGADSVYFIEHPKEEVLRFLGLYGSRYYEYWFPAESAVEEVREPVIAVEEVREPVVAVEEVNEPVVAVEEIKEPPVAVEETEEPTFEEAEEPAVEEAEGPAAEEVEKPAAEEAEEPAEEEVGEPAEEEAPVEETEQVPVEEQDGQA